MQGQASGTLAEDAGWIHRYKETNSIIFKQLNTNNNTNTIATIHTILVVRQGFSFMWSWNKALNDHNDQCRVFCGSWSSDTPKTQITLSIHS